GLAEAHQAADPGGAGFPDIALDDRTGVEKIRRHSQRRSRMIVSERGSPSISTGSSSSPGSASGSGSRAIRPMLTKCFRNSSSFLYLFPGGVGFAPPSFLPAGLFPSLVRSNTRQAAATASSADANCPPCTAASIEHSTSLGKWMVILWFHLSAAESS